MKRTWIAVVGVVLLAAAPLYAEEQNTLQTSTDKESYSAGVEIVRNLMRQGGAVNLDAVIQGMKDGLTGQELLMTEEELRMALAARQAGGQEHQAIRLGGAPSMSVNAEGKDLPAAPKGQQILPQRREQPGDEGQLASASSSGGPVSSGYAARAASSGVQQGTSGPLLSNAQTGPVAPNGMVLSRRNQAKIDVQSLKAEMRARAMGGQ